MSLKHWQWLESTDHFISYSPYTVAPSADNNSVHFIFMDESVKSCALVCVPLRSSTTWWPWLSSTRCFSVPDRRTSSSSPLTTWMQSKTLWKTPPAFSARLTRRTNSSSRYDVCVTSLALFWTWVGGSVTRSLLGFPVVRCKIFELLVMCELSNLERIQMLTWSNLFSSV